MKRLYLAGLLLLGLLQVQAKITDCAAAPDWEDVLLPNPKDCTSYIQCANQQPIERYCPPDLHWSIEYNRCELPLIANCQEEKQALKNDFNKKFTQCAGVPEYIDVLLPNPADCKTYIQCVHQKPMVRNCPPGLHWSVSTKQCDWPAVAKCNVNSCEGVPEWQDVLMPNPEDCGSYIQCVHQQPMVRPCPTGLHWSANMKRCEWPETARCQENGKPTSPVTTPTVTIRPTRPTKPTRPTTTSRPTRPTRPTKPTRPTTTPRPTRPTRPTRPPTTRPPTTKPPRTTTAPKTDCSNVPDYQNVLLPNPDNCTSFIQCVNQRPMVRPCPNGLHWSVSTNRCDWPEVAKCKVKKICDNVPEWQNVLLPNPNNCNSYIQCVHQKPVVMPCPSGLHWNAVKSWCDWPANANCQEVNF